MTSKTTLTSLRRGDLSGVRALDLSQCGLTHLPAEVYGAAETLETLDLSGNALTSLPDDFNRLQKLKVLFCSGNRFDRLPAVLGDCLALSQLGFRRAGVREAPAEALPPRLRWLTLTDNALEQLPDALGHRPELQKLMLSGNRLRSLPESLSGSLRLELVRLGANSFEAIAPWLLELPSLSWLAWAGNPLDRGFRPSANFVAWESLSLGDLLGEGASGRIYQATWSRPSGRKPVAVKLFKGAMTSDGLPEREMAACLAAGEHSRLTGSLGQVSGHPENLAGLVMPLLPSHWRPLASPPSLESCSRDVYHASLRLPLEVGLQIAQSVGEAVAYDHVPGRGVAATSRSPRSSAKPD